MSFIYSKHGHNCREVVTVAGSFQPEGTDAPTKVAGLGCTISRLGVGKYAVTLVDNALTRFVSAQCSLAMTTPDGSDLTFVVASGAVYDRTNNRVVIQALDVAGSAVELDQASDGSVVCFTLHFSKSSLPVV